MRLSSRWLDRLRWTAVVWIVVFWRLGYTTLQDPDEAHYAQLTREMLRSGNWLVPLLNGKPLIDKPVLFHWLQGLSVTLLGESEFAARLPSAIAAVALFPFVRWVGARLFDSERDGEWGALMFATIPATFALSSLALFDMIFTAFLFGAVGCLLVAAKTGRRRVEAVGYGLLTLAVMTKGPVAVVLIGGFLGLAWLLGGELRTRVSQLRWIRGLILVALAASPWFVWMYLRFGKAFVEGYVLAGNLWYFTQPPEFSERAVSHTFYLRAFAGAFFPWSLILAGRGVDVLRRRGTGLEWPVEERLLWLWTGLVVGFFSIARFKLDTYIFPAAPACCLIAARAWGAAAAGDAAAARATRVSIWTLAGMLVAAGAFGAPYLFDLNLELPGIALALPIVLLAGGLALFVAIGRAGWRVPASAGLVIATLLGVYATTVIVGYPVLEQIRPTAAVGRHIAALAPPAEPVALYKLSRWRASLRYYSHHPMTPVENEQELRSFIQHHHRGYIVCLHREFEALRRARFPLRVIRRERAVVGTAGRGLRRQRWGEIVLATTGS